MNKVSVAYSLSMRTEPRTEHYSMRLKVMRGPRSGAFMALFRTLAKSFIINLFLALHVQQTTATTATTVSIGCSAYYALYNVHII